MSSNLASASPLLSVVVIGRNEGERLRLCLQSVLAMQFSDGDFELIYVDSGSTDGSSQLAEALGARTISLSGFPTSAARGRNAGWRTSRAPFLLFLDGDTILNPGFAKRALAYFEDPNLAAICGLRREARPDTSLYNRVLDLDWNPRPGWVDYVGGDAMIRRASLEAVGGYKEELMAGEEPEMCRRLRERGWRILHVNLPMTLHDLAMSTFAQYWRRSVRTGYAYAEVSQLFASSADPLWRRESARNAVRGTAWATTPLLALAGSWLAHSLWPVAAFVFFFGFMAWRSAFGVRRATPSLFTAAIYGCHSHVQQIPILVGQVRYWASRVRKNGSFAFLRNKVRPGSL